MFIFYKKNSKKKLLIEIGIILMIACSTIDQGGALLIKYISYIYSLVIILCYRLKWDSRWKNLVVFIFLLWPLVSIGIGIINDGVPSMIINNVSPFIPAILFLFLLNTNMLVIALKAVIYSLLFMSIVTIFIYILFIFLPSSVEPISDMLNSLQMGYFGIKAIEETGFPGVYFKCTLFYNFSYTIFLFRRKYAQASIVLLAIIFSFSKSAIATSFVITILYLFRGVHFYEYGRICLSKYSFIIGSIIIIMGVVFIESEYFGTFYSYFENTLTGQAGTTQVRVGHYKSILELFKNHWEYLIFGQGAGTEFYTYGFNAFTNNIELDHLNAIRKFGLIWAVPFYAFILILFKDLMIGHYDAYGIAFITTFLLVGTNPLMINPLFLLITIVIYKLVTSKSLKNDISVFAHV